MESSHTARIIVASVLKHRRDGRPAPAVAADHALSVRAVELIVAAAEQTLETVHFETVFTIPTPGQYTFHLSMAEVVWPDGVRRRGSVRLARVGGLPRSGTDQG